MKRFLAFWKQPLNQGALAAAAGTALAVLQGSMTWQHAVPLAVGALVALIIPDNSVAKEDIEVLVAGAIKAAQDLQKGPK
ncbi:MAG: hypothetical protein ACREFO_05910 [Acetobacteraceae bacterium]